MIGSVMYFLGLFVVYTFCTIFSATRLRRMELYPKWLVAFFLFGPHTDALFMAKIERKILKGIIYFTGLTLLVGGMVYLLIELLNMAL